MLIGQNQNKLEDPNYTWTCNGFLHGAASHKTQNEEGKAFPLHVYFGYLQNNVKLFERCETRCHF